MSLLLAGSMILAAAMSLVALLPVWQAPTAKEVLRRLITESGCRQPVVAMRSFDGQTMEIEILCSDPEPDVEEDPE